MSDERLAMRDGTVRGLLSALWSFLQHPVSAFEDHLTALEESVAGAEHRLENDVKRAVQSRMAAIQARLESVRSRVVADLKHELRRVALVLALVMGCALLGLLAMTFGLMAAWMSLKGLVGAIGASLVLAGLFLLSSLVVFRVLHSMLHKQR
jgi:hypothetical protein